MAHSELKIRLAWLILGLALLVAACGPLPGDAGNPAAAPELRGVYLELHGNPGNGTLPLVPDGDWRRLFRELKGYGINVVLPWVVSPSGAAYPSRVVPVRPGQEGMLATLVEAAHAEGLEIHPWTIEWYDAPEGTDPARLVHTAEGQTDRTLCPSQEQNRALMRELLLELARDYQLDGLQYDYMRLPGREYCFCDSCREAFERMRGEPVADWPAAAGADGPLAQEYSAFLERTISSFVEEMYPLLKAANPKLAVSAAVWCHDSLAGNPGVRQDWGAWVERRWLDWLAPMNYGGNKSVSDRFEQFARSEARHVVGKMPLVFGVGAIQCSPEEVVEQVRIGRELGGAGVILYTLNRVMLEEQLPVLARELWSRPAPVPSLGRE